MHKRHNHSLAVETLRIMAAKPGEAIKHHSPRGRELSRTHDYEQRRRSSGKKVLKIQEENPSLSSSRRSGKTSQKEHPSVFSSSRSMFAEQPVRSGNKILTSHQEQPGLSRSSRTVQGRVRSKEQYKIDLFGANSSNRCSTQYLSRRHNKHLDDRASSTHVQQVSRGQATSVLIPGEHKEQGTASVLRREDSSIHGPQHGVSSKQLSICDQGLSRSQRRLRYSTSHDISESQVQPWVPSQQFNFTTTQNQDSWKNGCQGHIRVDVNVMLHASPGLKEIFPSTQQQIGPFANIGAMIDEIYNWIR